MQKHFISLLFSTFLWADTIGGEASIGLFNHSIEGSSSYHSLGTVNLSDTLDFSSGQDIFFKVYAEHIFPLFPNIKITYNSLSHNSSTDVQHFTWGDIQSFTGNIDSSLSLKYTDATLYYKVLDNWTEIDAGFTFRYLKGDMSINTPYISDTVAYSTLVPMLYGKARFNIPATNLSVQIEANLLSFSSINTYSYELSTRYSFMMGVGIEAGYKAFHLVRNDLLGRLQTDLDFSGPYISAIWDF